MALSLSFPQSSDRAVRMACGAIILVSVIAAAALVARLVISLTAGADWKVSAPQQPTVSAGLATGGDFSTLERVTPLRVAALPAGQDAVTQDVEQAPETTLDLTLHGFRLDGDAATSIAVISSAGAAQKDYRVGDPIEGVGGVSLTRIFADGVLIDRNGEQEWLPKRAQADGAGIVSIGAGERALREEANNSAGAATRTSAASGPGAVQAQSEPPNDGAMAAPETRRVRTRINREELFSLAESVRLDSNTGDVAGGFSVFPVRNAALFQKSGLRAGDVIQRVGGVTVTNEEDLMRVLETSQSSNTVEIGLVRNRAPVELVIALED